MSQTPSSAGATYPTGRFDIGPGGIITDSPANRELLELIENTPPLSPLQLYSLAVSYQNVPSNSGLGNRLAFIALDNIFQSPVINQARSAKLQTTKPLCPLDDFWDCCVARNKKCNCDCGIGSLFDVVTSVSFAGFDLLVEVTRVDETKTYAILGVSPSVLPTPYLPIQGQAPDGDCGCSDETPEQPQNQ